MVPHERKNEKILINTVGYRELETHSMVSGLGSEHISYKMRLENLVALFSMKWFVKYVIINRSALQGDLPFST